MQKLTALFLMFVIFFSASGRSFAAGIEAFPNNNILFQDDGSYITRVVQELSDDNRNPLVPGEIRVKTGTATYTKTSGNGTVLWTAILTGTFTYDGYSSSCIAANCSVTFFNSHYSLGSKNVTTSGNTAIAVITVLYKVLGITISSEQLTLTLSCDSFGNLS